MKQLRQMQKKNCHFFSLFVFFRWACVCVNRFLNMNRSCNFMHKSVQPFKLVQATWLEIFNAILHFFFFYFLSSHLAMKFRFVHFTWCFFSFVLYLLCECSRLYLHRFCAFFHYSLPIFLTLSIRIFHSVIPSIPLTIVMCTWVCLVDLYADVLFFSCQSTRHRKCAIIMHKC